MITHERLKQVLNYIPDTGLFFWLIYKGRGARVGDEAGTNLDGRISIMIDRKRYLAHRLAWLYTYGKWPENVIDHIDHNTLNNRIENLRDVTISGNQQNQIKPQAHNQSGFLGVYFHKKAGKYLAQLKTKEQHYYLGLFDTPEEAHAAYVVAKRIHHSTCTL